MKSDSGLDDVSFMMMAPFMMMGVLSEILNMAWHFHVDQSGGKKRFCISIIRMTSPNGYLEPDTVVRCGDSYPEAFRKILEHLGRTNLFPQMDELFREADWMVEGEEEHGRQEGD